MHHSLDTCTRSPMYRYLMILNISAAVGLQGWRTLFDNFAVQAAGLDGHHIGAIQSVRELPGFLTLLVIYIIRFLPEHRLSALSILIFGFGIAATGWFPHFYGVMITTLIMSLGFHYYETTNQSLTLQYFDKQTAPWVFGKLRSLGAASNIGVGVVIFIISPFLSFTQMYVLLGICIIASALWAFFQKPADKNLAPQHKKMIFKKRYGLFYFLTFMAGARRQIFVAFAVFLMVKKFGFTIQEITLLFVLNNIVNYYLSPLIGKSIIRFGERKVLSLEYMSLIFVFSGYAFADSKLMVTVLYILDHVFFNFSIAIRTYFQKIGDPADIAPSMAVGFTINHIAAVALPVAGGLLWVVNYRIPFMLGAVLSMVSFIAVQRIKT